MADNSRDGLLKQIIRKLQVLINNGSGGGGGGNVTITSPLGEQSSASSTSVTLSTEDRNLLSGNTPITSTVNSITLNDTTAVTLSSDNTNRKVVIIYNDSDEDMYIKYGIGATNTDFTIFIKKNNGWVVDNYTGIVTGILDNNTGDVKVTETIS